MRNKLLSILLVPLFVIGLISVHKNVQAQTVDFTFHGICVGSPTNFTATATGITPVSWSWNFGDGFFGAGQNIAHTYAGTNVVPGYSVVLTVVDILGNTYTANKFVSIQDLPNVFFTFSTPTCSGDSVHFTDLSSTTYGFKQRYVWNFGDGSPNDTIYFNNNPNIAHLFPTFGTFNVTLEVRNSDSCVNSTTIPVTIIPSPIANFFFTGRCEDQTVQFTDASAPNGAGNIVFWEWNFGDPISGFNNTSTLLNPTHQFQLPGTYNVVLKVTNFNNCTDTMTKQVVIHPHPPVDFTYTSTCLNELIFFSPDPLVTNIPSIQTFQWDFGDGLNFVGPNAAHAYISPGIYTVILIVTDTLGCQNTISKQIEIFGLPVALFDAGVNNCAGSTVTFTNNSNTVHGFIVRWEWDFGDGTQQVVYFPGGNPNVTHTYATPGSYNVTLFIKASDSCSDIENHTINILPNPVADFDYTLPCFGDPVQFTDLTQMNGGGSVVSWNWNFGDPPSGIANFSTLPDPLHTFTAPGTYQVILSVASGNGCTDADTLQVIVKPKPAVDFTTTHNCQNNDVEFHPNLAVMSPGAIQTWFWQFGDGLTSPAQSPLHTYTVPGFYSVTLTVTDTAGCKNSFTKLIQIVPEPIPNFTYSQPACRQSAVLFTNQSLAPVGFIVKYEWDFGDGTPPQIVLFPGTPSVTHIFANYATFNVTLTVTTNDSCEKSITIPVVISPNPLSNFSFLTTCKDSPVQFNSLAQPGAGNITNWSWNFGDPPSGANNTALIANPTHVFTSAATYTVSLIVTNTAGCSDTMTKSVLVHALPAVDFTISAGCVSDSTHFVSTGFVNAGAVVTRVWDFGDGFTATNVNDPYHIYTLSGVYTVTLSVTDTAGCTNIRSHVVSIVPPPTSFFQISTQNCANNPIFFTNLSTTSGGTFTSFYWDFGDGNDTLINAPANGNVSHIYTVAGPFTVNLTVYTSLGCEKTFPRTFTVSASPLAAFTFGNTCAGTAVLFNDLSQVNTGTAIVNWFWNFGDGASGANNTSNLQNPLHVYNTPGTYTVLLLVENASGCPDTLSKTVSIKPKPGVDFNWASTCLGSTTVFTTNTTATNIGAVSSYDWDFGDGTPHNTTQQNPVHNYTLPGNYTVTLMIVDTAGCENQISKILSITPQPTAIFSITSACLGASTRFKDESFTPNGSPIVNWHWNFGETAADTSNLQNPSYIYSTLGIYTVTLIVTSQSGCQDTATKIIQVFGNPTASFSYTAKPCDNNAVYFQDSSYGQQATIVGWNWQFGPGNFSTLQNPVYNFYAPDSCYHVRLIITDNRGCVDTLVSDSVCVPADFNFMFQAPNTCFGDTTFFIPQILAPAGDSLIFFKWDFGEPASGIYNTSTQRFPSHRYSTPGTYTVKLESTDLYNCPLVKFASLVVYPLPVPQFSFTSGVCDSTINFNEISTGSGSNLTTWIWDFGDGTIDTLYSAASADTSHLYLNPGLYTVGLTVVNARGCSNVVVDSNVLVKPCLNAEFELIDTLICQNNMLSFADSSFSGLPTTEWYWDFGDGTDTTYYSSTNPVNHVFRSAGTFFVKLKIFTDVAGQQISDSTIVKVIVSPTPLPDFSYGVVCYLQTADFTNMTSLNGTKIKDYSWTFGEPTSAPNDTTSIKNPSHLYNAPGTYDVKLVAQNTIGCVDSVQKVLTVYGLPDANYNYSLSCAGDKTAFNDLSVVAIAPLVSWDWTFLNSSNEIVGREDIQNPDFIFETPGNYLVNLMVRDTNGCFDTINQNITTWSIPSSIYSYQDNFNDVQGQLQFTNGSIDATKYYWTFGNGDESYAKDPVAFYQNDGKYQITLITWNENECTDTLTIEYKFMIKGLYIPNAFSPNNPIPEVRLLKPVGINLKEYRFEVYDRWGNILWWTDKLDTYGRPSEGWDGKYNGLLMQEGAYVWKASGIFKDGSIWDAENIGNNDHLPKVKAGTSTMIR